MKGTIIMVSHSAYTSEVNNKELMFTVFIYCVDYYGHFVVSSRSNRNNIKYSHMKKFGHP